MKPFKTDIAVALIFFNRPEPLQKVFEKVAEARPSRLYLIQDGARANRPADAANIAACRKIVENIDWDCTVIRDYSEENLGCGRRIFSGLSNVFENEEYAAIIEDDIVIGESFLPFCKEMCERYKNDERIQMIGGMNHIGIYKDCPYSYFFAKGGSAIWGWATWRRCWQELKWTLDEAADKYLMRCLANQVDRCGLAQLIVRRAEPLRKQIECGKFPSFWSFHFGFYGALSNRIHIVPKYNLISNIGLTADSAHAVDSINKLPKRLRQVFFAPIYSMDAPLVHPKFVVDDQYFYGLQSKIMRPTFFETITRLPIRAIRKLFK